MDGRVEKLEVGTKAPPFSVTSIAGEPISTEGYLGKKWMLSFYRYAACPLCNLRVHRLGIAYPELHRRGLHLAAVFQSPKASILEHVGPREAPFPIVGDPDRELYKLYGVEPSWTKFLLGAFRATDLLEATKMGLLKVKPEGDTHMVPADFLIDEALIVRRAFYGRDVGDHLPLEEVEAFVG